MLCGMNMNKLKLAWPKFTYTKSMMWRRRTSTMDRGVEEEGDGRMKTPSKGGVRRKGK